MADTWVEEPELEKEEELAAISQVWGHVKKRGLTAHAHKRDNLEVITEYKQAPGSSSPPDATSDQTKMRTQFCRCLS